jgi:hypothetical protein
VKESWSRLAAPALLAAAALLALAGFVLILARSRGSSAAGAVRSMHAGTATVASGMLHASGGRLICSFSNSDAVAAKVQGADGGQSVVVGGTTYWIFGDTLFLPASGKQIEPNTIASSSGGGSDACPKLTYFAQGGVAVPFVAKDGSLTVWPAGAFAVDDHDFDVYTVYVYGSGPWAYEIGEVGIDRVDTRTMTATTTSRALWTAASGFEDPVISADPAGIIDGELQVVLQTKLGDHLLARVPPADDANASKYEYWDGHGWSDAPSAAAPIWPHPHAADNVGRLAAFESGGSVAYNAYLRAYVAVVNDGIDKIAVRTAPRLEGPWSGPTPIIDCSPIAQPAVPVCYSPSQHPQLAGDGGRSLFITFTRMGTYDVVAYHVELGPPGAE